MPWPACAQREIKSQRIRELIIENNLILPQRGGGGGGEEVKEAWAQEEVKMTRVWERESRGRKNTYHYILTRQHLAYT